jgi:hypothetical protein
MQAVFFSLALIYGQDSHPIISSRYLGYHILPRIQSGVETGNLKNVRPDQNLDLKRKNVTRIFMAMSTQLVSIEVKGF